MTGGTVLDDMCPTRGTVIDNVCPTRGTVLDDMYPSRGAVIDNVCPTRGTVLDDMYPSRALLSTTCPDQEAFDLHWARNLRSGLLDDSPIQKLSVEGSFPPPVGDLSLTGEGLPKG